MKPILLETKNPTGIFLSKDKLLYSITNKVRDNNEGRHIYLIDETAEIKEGEDVYYLVNWNGEYQLFNNFKDKTHLKLHKGYKVVASTDSSLKIESELSAYYHNGVGGAKTLPLLSNQSIKLLIYYYNKNGKIPESVEVEDKIEYEEIPRLNTFQDIKFKEIKNGIKLNSQGTVDISIPEDRMYTRADIIHAFTSGHNKAKMGMSHSDALIEYKKEQNI